MGKNGQDNSVAYIGGIFAIIAAFIGGGFLILNTFIDKGIDAALTPKAQIVVTTTLVPPASNPSNSSCPSISSAQIEQIRSQQDVASAIQLAEKIAGYQQNDYKTGEVIPVNVVIATNLYASPSDFPVSPINNTDGWGLFLTLESFIAPNDGTYWCVQ